MERELNRKLGDIVWFISKNKATSGRIKSISYCKLDDIDKESYVIEHDSGCTSFDENEVFGTREELIKSL